VTDQEVAEFRANGGRLGGPLTGTPVLLLHHVGARTGTRRVTPLAYSCHGDRLVIVASNGGAPTNPAWLHNLRAHPDIAVEIGTDTVPVHAAEPSGHGRDALWDEVTARYPDLSHFRAKTARSIPLITLQRTTVASLT
jgi:deazaflavin-dependent oxidoreductase (nitroreductase family)